MVGLEAPRLEEGRVSITSIFTISRESTVPLWGTISNTETCQSLFKVAKGLFLLQALFVNSLHRLLSTLSFINMTVWTFCSVHACSNLIFFPFECDCRYFKEQHRGNWQERGGKREVEKKGERSLSLHKFLHIN